MKKSFPYMLAAMVVWTSLNQLVFCDNQAVSFAGFPPIDESTAYQQYQTRPVSELSKIIYLVDRFVDSKIQIKYDDHYYSAPFTARVARWFVSIRYKNETAKDWILKWCNTSVPAGNLIWVKFPDGHFRLAREILLNELTALEKKMKEQQTSSQVLVDSLPMAELDPAENAATREQALQTNKAQSAPNVVAKI